MESLQISNTYFIAIHGLTLLLAIALVRLLFFRGPIPHSTRYKWICGVVFLLFALLLTILFPTYIAYILPIQFVIILASVFCLYSSYEYPNQNAFYPTKSYSSDLGAESIFTFFDHMPLGYAILQCALDNDQKLKAAKILKINDAASRIFNQPIEFVENNTLNNVLPTIDHLLIEQFSCIFCKKMPSSTRFTHPNLGKTYQIYAFPIDHLLLGVVFLNITENFSAEKEYYDFVNTTSHELRTSITAIRESFHLLTNTWNTEKTQPQLHLQEICLRNISKMKNLIEKILDYQKFTAKEKQPKTCEQINEIVENVYFDQLPLALSKNLKMSYQPDKNLPSIMINRDGIEIVISNLVNNAIKYSQQGTILISTKIHQNGIIIQIQDEGIGIPEKEFPTIFEPYTRIHKLHQKRIEGSGLGLSIAKKIVLEHEGTLTVESVENKGSLFSVFLPK
jgi:nitrogen fixation/metabolism regulation signal transduction histidine kinase